MWTRKAGLLIFLSIISVIIGLIINDFQFLVLALMIFTFFLLVATLPRPRIAVDRIISNSLMFEDGELRAHLKIRKMRPGFGTVEVYDKIPEYADLKDGINNMIYNIPDHTNLHYRLKFPLRGYYSVGPTQVRTADHFNIFFKDQTIFDKDSISIYPRIAGLKELNFRSKKNIHFPGEFLTREPGSSTEFFNIRDYTKTDPFKKINWKVYARRRELMVNEYEKENICDTILFLDARSITNIGTIKVNTLEMNIKLALAISNFLILRRNQVGAVVYNDQVKVLPPKPGIRHRNEILRFLTGAYAKGWNEFSIALDYMRPYIRTKTTVMILSNLEYDPSFLSSVRELISLNNRVMVISPSPIDFELNAASYTPPPEKVDLVKLGRENFIAELRSFGVVVIDYLPEDTVENIMDRVSLELMR